MSTNDENGISFSILPEESRQHFRLLELPPELLKILTSENPTTLQLKSQDGRPGQVDTNAVVCSRNETFDLRQVNTSNSVYIMESSNKDDEDGEQVNTGLQAIAESDSTLELIPIPPHTDNGKATIRALLPTYSSTGHNQTKNLMTRDQLFANIPFSEMDCANAYEQMMCFELDDPCGCFIPSAQVRISAWKAILEEAAVWSIDLTKPMSLNDSLRVVPQTTDFPRALLSAVRAGVTVMLTPPKKVEVHFVGGSCVAFVGLSQLESMTVQNGGATNKTKFMAAWADLLPEKWRSDASLDQLKNQYVLSNEGRDIAFAGTIPGLRNVTTAVPAAGTKRKWHDKFRASKKAAP